MTEMFKEALAVSQAVSNAGGVPLAVGGFVRDSFLGLESKDIDIEVHGMGLEDLMRSLSPWKVDMVGASFGVIKVFLVGGEFLDVSLPRRDSKVGGGHRGFEVSIDPTMGFEDAFRRRDLTINAIGKNLLTGEVVDPFGGVADIKAGILREVDPDTFVEDPLRALRVAQFASRFGFEVSQSLLEICSHLPIMELPVSRLEQEFEKLWLKGKTPSIGLKFLSSTAIDIALGLDFTQTVLETADRLDKGADFPTFLSSLVLTLTLKDAEKALNGVTTRKKDVEKALNLRKHIHPFLNTRTVPQVKKLSLDSNIQDLSVLGKAMGFDFISNTVLDMAQELGIHDKPMPLFLQGKDLLQLGFKPGPVFGSILKDLEEAQIEGLVSDRNQALEFVKKFK